MALDLGSLNIQRGRDHGLPPYVQWRQHCGLDDHVITDWRDLGKAIESQDIIKKLKKLYGHPGNIDLWVGGLLETGQKGSRVGPTVQCLLADQFKRLRDGDRFWYENPSTFKPDQLAQLRQVSLARIICDNSDDVQNIHSDVFKLNKGSLLSCDQIPKMDLSPWHDSQQCHKDIVQGRRVRRSTSDIDSERIEGLEVIIMKNKLEMARMRRRIVRMHRMLTFQNHGNAVCIDYGGAIRSEGSFWTHKDASSGLCAGCLCQVTYDFSNKSIK